MVGWCAKRNCCAGGRCHKLLRYKTRMKRNIVHHIPRYKNIEVNDSMIVVARSRTRHLEAVMMRKSLQELLIDSYL